MIIMIMFQSQWHPHPQQTHSPYMWPSQMEAVIWISMTPVLELNFFSESSQFYHINKAQRASQHTTSLFHFSCLCHISHIRLKHKSRTEGTKKKKKSSLLLTHVCKQTLLKFHENKQRPSTNYQQSAEYTIGMGIYIQDFNHLKLNVTYAYFKKAFSHFSQVSFQPPQFSITAFFPPYSGLL